MNINPSKLSFGSVYESTEDNKWYCYDKKTYHTDKEMYDIFTSSKDRKALLVGSDSVIVSRPYWFDGAPVAVYKDLSPFILTGDEAKDFNNASGRIKDEEHGIHTLEANPKNWKIELKKLFNKWCEGLYEFRKLTYVEIDDKKIIEGFEQTKAD